jgi:uncharacterized protein
MIKKTIFLGLALLLSACAKMIPDSPRENPKSQLVPLKIGGEELRVEVRDTEAGRSLGYSFRDKINRNEGMLFVFPVSAPYPFWMKGMRFDLDMVWIKDAKVVGVSEGVKAPDNNYGKVETVFPPQAVNQVLEVKSGWVKDSGIKVGDEVQY